MKTKIAILSSYTANNLILPLRKILQERGVESDIKLGGYDQFNQELRDKSSFIYSFSPDFIFICLSTETFLADFDYSDFLSLKKSAEEKVDMLIGSIESYGKSNVILTSFNMPSHTREGLNDFLSETGTTALIRGMNDKIKEFAKKSGIMILDFEKVCSEVGKKNVTDQKMFYLGKMFLSILAAQKTALEFSRFIFASYGLNKKVIAIDLDNTLFGGVIGEDGLSGIKLGNEGIGKIYQDIQKQLLLFYKKGILLAIVSKNNIKDVEPLFSDPRMILKKEHFACLKINWERKSKNIIDIAKELNLGVESIVFLDDNPAERLEVKSMLPNNHVIEFPEDVSKLPALLKELDIFDSLNLTDEDKKRNEMYLEERKREELKKTLSAEDYLKELEIKIQVSKNDVSSIERITQLINKTNQFNLRTIRHTKEEIMEMISSERYDVFSVRVFDKFGELGLTGILIFQHLDMYDFIETFLLSCRVMSRGIEKQFFLECLKQIPRKEIRAEYIKTEKNLPVVNLYDEFGFNLVCEKDGKKEYLLKDKLTFSEIKWINVLKG